MKQLPIESWQDVRQVQAGMVSHLMYDFWPVGCHGRTIVDIQGAFIDVKHIRLSKW